MDFSRSNGLMNRECEIILLNEDGVTWRLLLNHHKTQGHVYIRRGWRSFCRENKKSANAFLTFKLVQTGIKPVLQLCSSVNNLESRRASSPTSQDRFLTLTLTPYNLKKFKLVRFNQPSIQSPYQRCCNVLESIWQCLPLTFVKANGLENASKITLVDRYGIKRTTTLKPDNKHGIMRLGKEWREFCEVNGVKVGESFKMELINEEEEEEEDNRATHLLKFCSKVYNSRWVCFVSVISTCNLYFWVGLFFWCFTSDLSSLSVDYWEPSNKIWLFLLLLDPSNNLYIFKQQALNRIQDPF